MSKKECQKKSVVLKERESKESEAKVKLLVGLGTSCDLPFEGMPSASILYSSLDVGDGVNGWRWR